MIHVCSLAALPDTVKATGASHVLTVMANVDQVLDRKRFRRRVYAQSASRRNLDRTTDSRRLPDRVAEPVDREPGGPGFGARWADAARPRRNGSGQPDDRRPAVSPRSRLMSAIGAR